MDATTLKAYSDYADQLIKAYSIINPSRLYELIETFFQRDRRTLDVGCGSGRDIAYLQSVGFNIEGIDAVPEFLTHIQRTFPSIHVHQDELPTLSTIPDNSFGNILVSAVLMHLPDDKLFDAVRSLLRITQNNGKLLISVKKRFNASLPRDEMGRLFTDIPPSKLKSLFESQGGTLLFYEMQDVENRKDISWHNFVFEKRSHETK